MSESGYLCPVPAFQALPMALRLLLDRSSLTQTQLAQLAGLSISVVNRTLTGKQQPSIASLDAMLDTLSATPSDLAKAIDEARGYAPARSTGKPRPEWVSALAARGLDRDALWGFAMGALDRKDIDSAADFVASVEAAAREIAQSAVEEARGALPRLDLVAEQQAPYNRMPPRKGKR